MTVSFVWLLNSDKNKASTGARRIRKLRLNKILTKSADPEERRKKETEK